jgi:hypothetical protein
MAICRPSHHIVGKTFAAMLAVEPVPEVCRWAALQYYQQEIVNTVDSNYRHRTPDYDLLVSLDTDAQEEKSNADFEDRGASDISNFRYPPTLVVVNEEYLPGSFWAIPSCPL